MDTTTIVADPYSPFYKAENIARQFCEGTKLDWIVEYSSDFPWLTINISDKATGASMSVRLTTLELERNNPLLKPNVLLAMRKEWKATGASMSVRLTTRIDHAYNQSS